MTRVPEMLAAGIPVAFGHDCVMDPWYSLGSADMLEVAHMGLHVAQMTSPAAMRQCFDAVTTTPAHLLGLPAQGVEVGAPADLVVLQAADPIEAIRLRAARLWVIRRGQILASSPPRQVALSLPGRPAQPAFLG
jgi:cytosine deaminase